MASVTPTSATPFTGIGACGLGSRSLSSDWMTNTSPGALVPLRPTELKMGGAMRPISSTLSTVGDGTSPTRGIIGHSRGRRGQFFGGCSVRRPCAGWLHPFADRPAAVHGQDAAGDEAILLIGQVQDG